MNFHLFLLIVISIVNFLLGVSVWRADKKNIINKSFFAFICFAILWIVLLYISDLPSQAPHAFFWNKLTLVSGLLFASSFTYFCVVFGYKESFSILLKPPFSFLILFLLSSLILITLFTNLVVEKIELLEWGTNIIPGNLYFLIGGFYLSAAIVGLGSLIAKYKKTIGIARLQLQYLLLGFLLAAIGILTTNLIHPAITGKNLYAKYGPYFVTFFIFFTALAITRYHLFGIEVILTEILIGMIGILLGIQIFMAPTTLWKVVNSTVFVLFCIFGWLLIKYTFREIKRREELEKISQAKSEFLSIASHQLRTPLSAIKGYLSMILEGNYGELSEKLKKPLENIYSSSERLIKLVNDLLNVTKVETGKIEMIPEKVDLEELIENQIKELEIKAKEKGLYLKFEKPKEKIPFLLLDREKIGQVILNLIDNGVKYTQQGGVTVSLERSRNSIIIKVRDTGEGLEKEDIEKLFESFSRGKSGRKFWPEGTGLGLYVAKKLVEMHKGKIWAESEGKGKGSTFFIELPLK